MGQRRVTDAFVSAVPPSRAARTLARNGVPYQVLRVGRRKVKVYLRDDVDGAGVALDDLDTSFVADTFVSASEGSEILGIPAPNVWKTMKSHEVPFQTLTVGRREMKVWLRTDVERVGAERGAKARARAKAKEKAVA